MSKTNDGFLEAMKHEWTTIPFDLELRVAGMEYPITTHEDRPYGTVASYPDAQTYTRKSMEVGRELRDLIGSQYPMIELHPATTLGGHYGGASRGAALHGSASIRDFTRIFGRNIRPGLSVMMLGPLPIPSPKWYATGDLRIPEDMQDLVKGAYLGRPATGSFPVFDFFAPRRAEY